jgi:hypothetical protein
MDCGSFQETTNALKELVVNRFWAIPQMLLKKSKFLQIILAKNVY